MKYLNLKRLFILLLTTVLLLVVIAGLYIGKHNQNAIHIAKQLNQGLIPELKKITQIKETIQDLRHTLAHVDTAKSNKLPALARTNLTQLDHQLHTLFDSNSVPIHSLYYADFQRARAHYLQFHDALNHDLTQPKSATLQIQKIDAILQHIANALDGERQLLQTEITQSALLLSKQNWVLNQLVIVGFVLAALIGFAAYYSYRKLVATLGDEPHQFVKTLVMLLDNKPVADSLLPANSLLADINQRFTRDNLTGLPNRIGLMQLIQQRIERGEQATLILLHFNHLHSVVGFLNSAGSRQALSSLLNRLGSLLAAKSDLTVFSADTFAIISSSLSDEEAIKRYLNAISLTLLPQRLALNNFSSFKVRFGVARFPQETQNPELLIEYAQLALREAKDNSDASYVFFNPDLLAQNALRNLLYSDLQKSVDLNELFLVFQPQVDMRTGTICGVEALVRWMHPVKGLIPPNQFIPFAEETGLIDEIGFWVLRNAISAAAAIHKLNDLQIPMPVSINISSKQLLTKTFLKDLVILLRSYRCEPEWIKLEVTEGTMLNHSAELLKTMMEISDLGIMICMDDFGTGYSSLSYLTQYPISQIKIDRSFMTDLDTRLEKRELVHLIVRIAEIFHFELVAEGVEDEGQLAFLSKTSCHIVQGFYFYKPMSMDALMDLIDHQTMQEKRAFDETKPVFLN